MFSLSAIPAVVQGIGMFFLPPSPRYLMLKKKEEKVVLKTQYLFLHESVGVRKQLHSQVRMLSEV